MFIDRKGLYICETLFPLVTKGAVLWRLASISTISNLLGIIHPNSSPATNVAAKVVVLLKSSSIWSGILAELAKLLDPEQTVLLEDNQLVEYAYQLVLLGYKLGKLLPGGVDMLYSSGYLTVLCHTSCMGEVITMKNAFLTSNNEDLQKAVLQLFNGIVQSITMLVTDYPLVKDNARLVARFLRKNNGLVIYLLRLQDSSITGVQVLSSVLNLLLASLSSLAVVAEKNWHHAEMGQELVGEIQELLPDCLAWLKIMGKKI
ncbi:hypothetical protein EON65_08065 [archaeon]|nr:MAG: hypothetical protein EON65_08065 [archaeon]